MSSTTLQQPGRSKPCTKFMSSKYTDPIFGKAIVHAGTNILGNTCPVHVPHREHCYGKKQLKSPIKSEVYHLRTPDLLRNWSSNQRHLAGPALSTRTHRLQHRVAQPRLQWPSEAAAHRRHRHGTKDRCKWHASDGEKRNLKAYRVFLMTIKWLY